MPHWHSRLILATLLFLTALLPACSSDTPPETLRILAWPGYADADLVQAFERRHQIKVEVTFVDSDDELWSRVSANQGMDFDVFAVNTAELQRYIDSGLSLPLDPALIPNLRNQSPRFQNLAAIPGLSHNNAIYAIPYTWSEMGLIFDRSRVLETPDSMSAMWDPRYQGKVLAYDGSNHNFTITALLLGIADPFHLTDEQFGSVMQKLVALRRNVLTFYTAPEEAVQLFRDNNVALVFGNYGAQQVKQLRDAGVDVGFVVPKEGVLAWLDCWSMTRGARNPQRVAQWINYTLEKDVSQALTERQGLANTITPSLTSVDSDKVIWLQPVEDFSKRAQLWEKIRSGDSLE